MIIVCVENYNIDDVQFITQQSGAQGRSPPPQSSSAVVGFDVSLIDLPHSFTRHTDSGDLWVHTNDTIIIIGIILLVVLVVDSGNRKIEKKRTGYGGGDGNMGAVVPIYTIILYCISREHVSVLLQQSLKKTKKKKTFANI